LADLPCLGRRVQLRVRARHFYCVNPVCPRKTFAERLEGTARVYARRTERLTAALLGLVYEGGGEAGAREARRLGMPVSGDTLRRIIHRLPLPPASSPTVVGVDDWGWKRGQRYGTILVDLERHCPTDLLPERSAESFAAWLAERPGVGVIARDRGNTYAEGATKGAPGAIQVADRFHLLRNVHEAVERFLLRHHTALRAASEDLRQAALDVQPRGAPPSAPVRACRVTKVEEAKRATQARRQARYEQVRALQRQGLSQRAIARTLRMSREAVRTFIRAESCPQYAGGARRQQASILDRFEPYLRRRWDAGCQNAAVLYRELREQGFTGAPETVRYYLRRWRPEGARPGKPARGAPWTLAPPAVATYSPRKATWLVVKPPEKLEHQERAYLEHLCRVCPQVETICTLAQEFGRLVRERDRAGLSAWLDAADGSGIAEMAGVAAGIKQDRAPVDAALAHAWSAGQTEGQINRLKLIKRQGYGRAGIDLLRKRVLPLTAIS
jgi:transposase